MRILFVHQNFPGQWVHLAKHYDASPDNEVVALRHSANRRQDIVRTVDYDFAERPPQGIYPLGDHFSLRTGRAAAVADAAFRLKQEGFVPDLIAGHAGWGETLFLREVFPDARQIVYAEFFYRSSGADSGFDAEFGPAPDHRSGYGTVARNAAMITALAYADRGLAPTEWQRSVFEPALRDRIDVIHDGVDTDVVRPDPNAFIKIGKGTITMRPGDELVTFVNRNLEPYRGYHVFMRALPALLRERPKARVVLVGGDQVSYGAPAPVGRSWKQIFWDEVRPQLTAKDQARVHFVGKLPYPQFLALLRMSAVHVYLTYPFVLSWSLLEAMALGRAVVASDTAPVREVITQDVNGRLVDFFDAQALASEVARLLAQPTERDRLGQSAARHVAQRYDLHSVCLPAQMALLQALA